MANDTQHSGIETWKPAVALVPGLITAGTLLVAFTLLAVDFEYFWVAFPVGFGVVLPTALGLAVVWRTQRTNTATGADDPEQSEDAALAQLRRRYAAGKLSDTEFEHRAEQLLETESLAAGEDNSMVRK